jgi:thiol-disulfide isomerase/thioredoxin
VDVRVKLGTYSAPATVDGISVSVSPLPNMWTTPKSLTKQDGFYDAEIKLPDGSYPFRVSVARPAASAVLADGYLTVADGKARVAFDLAKRPLSGASSEVDFVATSSGSPGAVSVHAGLTKVATELDRAQADYEAKLLEAVAAGRPATSVSASWSWRRPHQVLLATARASSSEVVRQAAGIALFGEGRYTAPTAEEVSNARSLVANVPPDDALWSVLDPRAFATVTRVAGESWSGAYVQGFVSGQADVDAVAELLASEMRSAKDDADKARAIVTILKEPRFEKSMTARFARRLDPDAPTAPGHAAPAFDVPALVGGVTDPNRRFTPKTFENKVYLVDVWATWCKPCVAELPQLHDLYATYGKRSKHGKRLEILSVSIDGDAGKVAAFRKERGHGMPWHNAVASDQETKALFSALGFGPETTSVPFYVLVDEQGKILASSPELSGATLSATVARALGAN